MANDVVLRSDSCYNKKCLKTLIKHNCWSAILLGAIMLGLGIVLRSAVFDTSSSSTVTSSGMLFILIGIFIICMGPFSAIYEIVSHNNRSEHERQTESGVSPRQSDSSNPPTYDQAVTALKSPSATYHMQYYPQVLSPQNLSNSRPPPPSYADITESETYSSISNSINQNRRMTVI